MKSFFASFLTGSLIFLALTFAGMIFLGNSHGVGMDMHKEATPHDTGCVDHCVDAASIGTLASPVDLLPSPDFFFAFSAFVLLVAFFFLSPFVPRQREGIGKIFLQKQLEVVILRD